jgi:hypothetical protein
MRTGRKRVRKHLTCKRLLSETVARVNATLAVLCKEDTRTVFALTQVLLAPELHHGIETQFGAPLLCLKALQIDRP